MSRTRKPKPTDVPETILDQFAGPARPMSQAEVESILKRFKKALVERMLGGELTHHLGYPPGGEKPHDATNHRNGTSAKTVLTEEGPLPVTNRLQSTLIDAGIQPKVAHELLG